MFNIFKRNEKLTLGQDFKQKMIYRLFRYVPAFSMIWIIKNEDAPYEVIPFRTWQAAMNQFYRMDGNFSPPVCVKFEDYP